LKVESHAEEDPGVKVVASQGGMVADFWSREGKSYEVGSSEGFPANYIVGQ